MTRTVKQGIAAKLGAGFEAAKTRLGKNQNVTSIEVDVEAEEIVVSLTSASASETTSIPEMIDDIPIRTRVANYVAGDRFGSMHAAEAGERLTTLKAGASIAHYRATAGTLGCFVVDNLTNVFMLLSNWHVAADGGVQGDPILQPGPFDGGIYPDDTVATLDRSIIDHRGDAAVAKLTGSKPFALDALISGKTILGQRAVKLGDVLEKSGRSTGVTQGKVTMLGVYYIMYSIGRVGVEGFRIEPLVAGNPGNIEVSTGGDSGSVWYDADTGAAVGLHFAGETSPTPSDEHAIACNIVDVLKALNVRMATRSDLEVAAYDELASLSPELGGFAAAGLVIGASANQRGKQSIEDEDLVTAFREGVVLARDYSFAVKLDTLSRELIVTLTDAVGPKAAATIIGAAIGSKA